MLYAKTLDYMNIFFTGVFTVESCLKLVAFKIKVRCCHLFCILHVIPDNGRDYAMLTVC